MVVLEQVVIILICIIVLILVLALVMPQLKRSGLEAEVRSCYTILQRICYTCSQTDWSENLIQSTDKCTERALKELNISEDEKNIIQGGYCNEWISICMKVGVE